MTDNVDDFETLVAVVKQIITKECGAHDDLRIYRVSSQISRPDPFADIHTELHAGIHFDAEGDEEVFNHAFSAITREIAQYEETSAEDIRPFWRRITVRATYHFGDFDRTPPLATHWERTE